MKEAFTKIKEAIANIHRVVKTDEDLEWNRAIYKCSTIVSEVEAEYMKNPVYQYAMVYAKNLVLFGVDVRENLDSAVAQSMALNQAYIKGVDDERKRMYEAEYGNGCEKQTYEICLNGCDDDTTFKMDLTESEYHFLSRVSELANKTSTYGCMPRLYVREYAPTTD